LQARKLKSAHKNNKAVSIRFSNDQIFNNAGNEISVSHEQYKKLLSASKSKAKRGATLLFSPSQIGGFLPMLLSALAGPLISGISNAVQGKNFFTGEGLVPLGSQRGRGATKKKHQRVIM
jgi:hypothetical protein